MSDLGARAAKVWKSARFRIVFWAVLTGVFLGVTGAGLPLEDILVNGRTWLRMHPSKGEIVMVLQDGKTLEELEVLDVSRANDAQVIRNLMDAGAKRVFFDRFLNDHEKTVGRDELLATFAKYRGRVFLGAMPSKDGAMGNYASVIPSRGLRKDAGAVSLLALDHPFNLSTSFPFASDSPIGVIPSLSAKIADVQEGTSSVYKPDYSIDYKTIPTASYVDVLMGRFDPKSVRGRDIIIAPSAEVFHDVHTLPMQGYVPGGYFHAIAAETLKDGVPFVLGWIPPFLLALVVIVTGVGRGRVLDIYRFSGLVVVLILFPLMLDHFRVQVDVFPAIAMATVAVFRMRNLDRVEVAGETNSGSGLPSVQVLRKYDAVSSRSSWHFRSAITARSSAASPNTWRRKSRTRSFVASASATAKSWFTTRAGCSCGSPRSAALSICSKTSKASTGSCRTASRSAGSTSISRSTAVSIRNSIARYPAASPVRCSQPRRPCATTNWSTSSTAASMRRSGKSRC
ncbi:CHASE2 domain-containing protein [Novosphingobium sp. ST904]|uniref:CHASE2 domain-containing protein n=1 Tax=Novosphingobium sp. ST904 TaxID=1684385 RepID=UPI001E47BEAA|nr:CHASE2 domain-containing protein [Novosphingobium sp. ST904]